MTYPQQPQYAYPQQSYAGPGPAAQPQYGQPPAPAYGYQQPAPVQQAPQAMYTPPQFSEPFGGGGEGGSPLKIREIEGRICGVQPVKYLPETFRPDGTKDSAKVILDILVLDGPTPLEYGASEGFQGNPPGPACYAVDSLPALIKGVTVGNWQVVEKAKEILDTAPGNTIPCRIVRGTKGNSPYFLAQIGGDLDPGTTPEQGAELRGRLGAAYAAVATGRWPDGSPYVAPVPREINGGPRQKPTQGAPAQPVAAPSYPPVQYPPAAPAGQVVYPPAGQQYAPPFVAAGTVATGAQYAPGSREAFLSGQDVPGGWQEQVWRGMTAEQRAQFLPAQ